MDFDKTTEDKEREVIETLDLEPADIPHGTIVLEK